MHEQYLQVFREGFKIAMLNETLKILLGDHDYTPLNPN